MLKSLVLFHRRRDIRLKVEPHRMLRPNTITPLRIAWVVLALGSSPAQAETTKPSPPACEAPPNAASLQAAQGAFSAGMAALDEGDYERAIEYWEDAYRWDCTAHAMLKNLARAYELNEQYQQAIRALKDYLERGAATDEVETIQQRIEDLAAQGRSVTAPSEPFGPKPDSPPSKVAAPRAPLAHATPAVDSAPSMRARSAWPLVVAGSGAITFGLSAAFWVKAKADERSAAERCISRSECVDPQAKSDGNDAIDRQVTWTIIGSVGAAAAAGGLLWYFLQGDEPPKVSAQLHPGFVGAHWVSDF